MLGNGRRAFLAAAGPTCSHGQLYWPRHASASAPTYASHIMLTIPGSSAVSRQARYNCMAMSNM